MATEKKTVVLIVEDEALIRLDVADYLVDSGFEPVEARNADEACLILETRRDIDVVFTDVNMPGRMSGIQLAAEVYQRWSNIAVVITSGLVRLTASTLPERAEFLSKPYDLRRLVEAITRVARRVEDEPQAAFPQRRLNA